MGKEDVIFTDELNHASIIDGVRLTKTKRVIFPHRDTDTLATQLEEDKDIAKKLIIGSATAASGDNTGALQISGGFSAQEKSTLSDELELTNTDIEVHIAVAATSTGIDVFGSIYEASIVSNTYNAAGRFSDGTREVEIADGTMAINATGGINTSDAFYHGLNQGLSRASNVNLVDDDGLAIPVIIGGGLILPR